ncbi:trace amine-associated receptor 7e-like [Acanthaster planci]|uniref:Trace amine-associated receptor 7e-like n=1 Tax=Acanthaster planci TaxID=133434 RepID=A0A8B7ZFE7_ACAPL|nr:trace amine-associated receptor 7e-like [Acanthaster planci]
MALVYKMENSTVDNSTSLEFCLQSLLCYFELAIIVGVTCLILVGNIVNLVVLLSTKSLRDNAHGYILISLSVADLGVGLAAAMSIYPAATFDGTLGAWPYGDLACAATGLVGHLFLTRSGNFLTILSVERFLAIAHPLKYARFWTKRVSLFTIGSSWIMELAMFVLLAIFFGYEYDTQLRACTPSFWDNFTLVLVLTSVLIMPSAVVILLTSFVVNRKLKESARLRAEMTPRSAQRSKNISTTIKAFWMVRVMAVGALMSWIPYFVAGSLDQLFEIELPRLIYFITYWLLLANSFFNSIIYFFMNDTFHDRLTVLARSVIPEFCMKLNRREQQQICGCCLRVEGTASQEGGLETRNQTQPYASQPVSGHRASEG